MQLLVSFLMSNSTPTQKHNSPFVQKNAGFIVRNGIAQETECHDMYEASSTVAVFGLPPSPGLKKSSAYWRPQLLETNG